MLTRARAWIPLTLLASLAVCAPGSATGRPGVQLVERGTPGRPVEHRYRATLDASWTVRVTGSDGPLDVMSSARIRFSTPLTFSITQEVDGKAMFLEKRPIGTYAVDVAGTDQAGCAVAYRKSIRTPMSLTVHATRPTGPLRMYTRTVPAKFGLWIEAYPVGELPRFTSACDLRAAVTRQVVGLDALLEAALRFNGTETLSYGAMIRSARAGWPFSGAHFTQFWLMAVRSTKGVARFPAPVSAFAAARPVTISRSLDSSRVIEGPPSTVTVVVKGRIGFTFVPVK